MVAVASCRPSGLKAARTAVVVVLHGRRVAVALPLEEMPLPAAPVEWALVEQLLGTAHVARGQFALCEGYTLGV